MQCSFPLLNCRFVDSPFQGWADFYRVCATSESFSRRCSPPSDAGVKVMETSQLIIILADLAKSEELYVESPEKAAADIPRAERFRGGGSPRGRSIGGSLEDTEIPNLKYSGLVAQGSCGPVSESRNANGTLWKVVTGFAWNAVSKVFQYVAGNYVVTAKVQLTPVNDLLTRLQDPHRTRLADKMRIIMNEHSIVDLNTLANKIQEDSSLVRQIVIKYLIEYLTDEMCLPVRIPSKDVSEEELD